MKTLVLGYDGFVGRLLLRYLAGRSDLELLAISRTPRLSEVPGISVYQCDLADIDATCRLIGELGPDVIVNVAGAISGDARALYIANTVIPVNIAQAMEYSRAPCRLIHVGSAAEYGYSDTSLPIHEDAVCRPVSLYGHSKLAASNFLMAERDQRGLAVTVVRPFNLVAEVNSPHQVIGAFVAKIAEQRRTGSVAPIKMGSLAAVRDFVCMDDLLLLVRNLIARSDEQPGIVNVCSGRGMLTRDVIYYLAGLLGRIEIIEETGQIPPKAGNRVIGDPTRFLAILGRDHATPLETVLDRIWVAAGLQQ